MLVIMPQEVMAEQAHLQELQLFKPQAVQVVLAVLAVLVEQVELGVMDK